MMRDWRNFIMNDIRDVLADNLKKFRAARGFSQATLAEKAGTSTHYIGMLETTNKFPSSEMIHKLAKALDIDPTELFSKELDPVEAMNRYRRAAFCDVGEATKVFWDGFIAEKLHELEPVEGGPKQP
jgi:transcriptional regulator with XRE-family HTH domain